MNFAYFKETLKKTKRKKDRDGDGDSEEDDEDDPFRSVGFPCCTHLIAN